MWEDNTWENINTAAQFDKEFKRLMGEIQAIPAFPDMSDKAKTKRLSMAENDKLYFARTYLPTLFNKEFAPFHSEWPAISEITDEVVLVVASRGFGKSSFFTIADALWNILFFRSKYLVFFGYNEKKSIPYSKRILAQLLANQRIASDFGKILFKPLGKKAFAEFEIYLEEKPEHTVKVQALSIGQDPRGFITDDGARPDYARGDDIQVDDKAGNPEWVKDTCNWILARLIGAMARDYSCIVLATFMNTQCAAATLEKGFEDAAPVKTFIFPAQEDGQEDGKPTWPAAWPLKELQKRKKVIGRQNYLQENLCRKKKKDDLTFDEKIINNNLFRQEEIEGIQFDCVVTHTDPAHKKRGDKKHCYKVVIGAGLYKGKVYILSCWMRKSQPIGAIHEMYRVYEKYNPCQQSWEDNGGQALLEPLFGFLAEQKGFHIPHKPVTSIANKETRIEQTLSVPVENGDIRFCREIGDTELLINQLVDFPDGFLDGPDALERAYRELMLKKISKDSLPRSTNRRQAAQVLRGY